jgi:hypothetical protein
MLFRRNQEAWTQEGNYKCDCEVRPGFSLIYWKQKNRANLFLLILGFHYDSVVMLLHWG